MAFRILNEEELQLLAGEQREQYEKELDIYRKRAAFVEQMEKYENADIRPFRPKLDLSLRQQVLRSGRTARVNIK